MLPRAISAARFNFASTFTGKNVPDEFAPVLRERFARYDFTWHGRAGANPNASLFRDRPDIEAYLLDRFVVVGTADQCVERLVALDGAVDGVFLSILFEDPCPEIARIGSALAAAGLLGGAPGDD
jgi:alkanesulfonate monooxygenase SsuD/methylene tetrahydromethanopterin reductase-like flavin-dependent oxidoreductase (luciferase family)